MNEPHSIELKEEIYNFVKTRRFVSFAEIVLQFGEGDETIELKDYNIVLWANLRSDVAEAILELLRERKLFLIPTHVLVYIIDGRVLSLPVAKRLRKYKKLHWLPVVLDIEPPKDVGRKKREQS
jgi:hypothetical protein